MKNKIIKITIITLLLIVLIFACTGKDKETQGNAKNTGPAYTFSLSLKKEAEHSLKLSYEFLQKSQFKDGSWKSHPAITSLVLYSLVEVPGYIQIDNLENTIKKGFTYLEGFVKEDGGIYQNEYRNYTTAVALLAFSTYGKKEHKDIIANAKEFLIRFQCDESEGYTEEDPYYGGIGYGGDERPDLSNTQLALDALKSAEDYEERYSKLISEDVENMETKGTEKGLYWEKALIFLARCQNVKEVNTMDYRTEDDGGFMYETGTYKEDRSHSYGSMTYAGVKSLLYAKVDRNDIRITKAVDWIRNNYTLEENPRFGTTSLYYYYMTFSKCLNILGENIITDAAGNNHDWREDTVKKLISLQNEDGSWVNADGRYWENIKDLATAYSIVAIKYAFKGLNSTDIK